MCPGVGDFVGQAVTHGMAVGSLQRVVVGGRGEFAGGNRVISAIGSPEDARFFRVNQDALDIAVTGGIATGSSRQFGCVDDPQSMGDLIQGMVTAQVTSQSPHISDAQKVMAWKLMLDGQVEL